MPRWPIDTNPARRLYHLQQALHSLKDAQESVRLAHAPYTTLKIRAAKASLEGAIRHAQGRETRQDHTRTVTKVKRPRRSMDEVFGAAYKAQLRRSR